MLLVVDTMRADRLSAYGYPERLSPYLDRLARQGLLFSRALAPSSFNMQNKKASLGFQSRATIRLGENDRGWALGDLYEGLNSAKISYRDRFSGFRPAPHAASYCVRSTLPNSSSNKCSCSRLSMTEPLNSVSFTSISCCRSERMKHAVTAAALR